MSEPSSPEEAAERLALILETRLGMPAKWMREPILETIRERDRLIRAEERERCARIADEAALKSTQEAHGSIWDIAAAIRAENIGESEERTTEC